MSSRLRHCAGSREDMAYFDSKMWFDSDCDDDFLSVDGGDETTPSRGTTPVHKKFADQTPKPVEEKHEVKHPKRLVELFKETQEEGDDDVAEVKVKVKARPGSGCLWVRTPGRSSAPATPYNHNKSTAAKTRQYKRVTSAGHRFFSRTHFNKSR